MRRRIGRFSRKELALAAVLIIALVVGVIVPGGTGDTIVAIAGVCLAFVLIFKYGISHPPMDREYPYGDERAEEPEEHFDPRFPGGLR